MGNNADMDIGGAITRAFAAKKVSAAEVSRLTGLTPGTISKYRSGAISPSLDAIELIANAIGCRVYELVADAEGLKLKGVTATEESADEKRWCEAFKALEPEARYAVEKLTAMLPKESPRDDRKSPPEGQ
jgi:transcriptional regulator with XRE-family HTH domain